MSQNNISDKGSPCINPKCLLKCKLQNIEHCTYSVNGISPYRLNSSCCNLQKKNTVLFCFIFYIFCWVKEKTISANSKLCIN